MSRVDSKYLNGNYESRFDKQYTFEDKLKMGNEDLGKAVFDRLNGIQGKEFRKEKHKLKNKTSYFGTFTTQDNTIPFL